jgi:hypothetical protein
MKAYVGGGSRGIAPYFLNLEQMDDSGRIYLPVASASGTGIRYTLSKRTVERYSRSEHLKKETRLVPARNSTANTQTPNPRFFNTLTELPFSVWHDSNVK